jgi:putative DNA primase/helicase
MISAEHTSNVNTAAEHLAGLLPHHLQELRASGLNDDTIVAAGIKSETDYRTLAVYLKRKGYPAKNGPAIVIPFFDSNGDVILRRVKPDNPPKYNGKKQKYLQPSGVPCLPYILPSVRRELERDPTAAVYITEGEKKALSVTQHVRPCIGLTGIDCWHRKQSAALLPDLASIGWKGRPVRIVFDAPANDDVLRAESELAAALQREGAEVKIVRLPPGPNGEKVGVDDFLVANGVAAFWRLVEVAEDPKPVEGEDLRRHAESIDPGTEAKAFLKTGEQDGLSRLRFYRGKFALWCKGAYREIADGEVRSQVVRHLDKHLLRLGRGKVGDVLMHVQAHSLLAGQVEAPRWLTEPPNGWRANDVIATPTQIVHLPSLFDDKVCTTKATPSLFVSTAIDYEFDEHAKSPRLWHQFLKQLWPEDQDAIDTLQEVFGYILAGGTSAHKIFMLLEPPRSGKGTVARVMERMVGKANCCSPTFASLTGPFGLEPLLNKTLALVSDARLSRRTDQAIVLERLLSISGEDLQTVNRKHRDAVTYVLPVRFVILSNELPGLDDNSGAFASRLIFLRFTEQFLGHEDEKLTAKLLPELPGILIWAISGLARLKDRGRFVQPEGSQELLRAMEDLASPIKVFLRERCEIGPYEVSRADLYAAYAVWCKDQGQPTPDRREAFGRNLRAALPKLRDGQLHSGERTYRGLRLRLST